MDGCSELCTDKTDHIKKHPADPVTEFVLKLEPAWSTEDNSPDQPSAAYGTAQPMSDNTLLTSLDSSHACYLCSATFVLVSSLELHLASVHREHLHFVLSGSYTPERFDVGDCNTIHINKEEYILTSRKKTMNKRKIEEEDSGNKDGKTKGKQYSCDICGKSFPRPSKLKAHLLIHSGAKPFKCEICSESFNRSSNLKMHKKRHSDDKPYVCDLCSKGFLREDFLKKHRMVHTGERPCKCPYCEQDFRLPASLQDHIISKHEKDRSHICDECGVGFYRSHDLTTHRRRNHTGEKPYVCSECGKGFVSSGELGKHQRRKPICVNAVEKGLPCSVIS